MSSPSVSSVLKTRPRWADDQTDLWCNLCKPFAPCEPENQRQDFRMALGQRLSSLCYLIANFHRLFSFTCLTFSFVFSDLWKMSCTGTNKLGLILSEETVYYGGYGASESTFDAMFNVLLDDTMTVLVLIFSDFHTPSTEITYFNLNQKVKHNYNRPLQQATHRSW